MDILVACMSWLLWIVLQWTLGGMYLFKLEFSPGKCLGVEFLDHTIALSLVFFLRNIYIDLHSGCINVHSHQQWRRVPFSPQPLQHLSFADFSWQPFWLMWGDNLIIVLICISLKCRKFEQLFMCLLAICMFSLEKFLFSSFTLFDWVVYFFHIELHGLFYIFWKSSPCHWILSRSPSPAEFENPCSKLSFYFFSTLGLYAQWFMICVLA